MRIYKFLLLIFFATGQLYLSAQPVKSKLTSFSYIQQQFRQPGKQYGSAPLWVWNTKVTRGIIDTMLTEFKQQAFGGVMVHPRPGLVTPYLSAEWFELWKYAMQKAKQLNMDIWIYDENSYPSGFAGGNVQSAMPESYNQGQMLRMTRADSVPGKADYLIMLAKQNDGSYKNITGDVSYENKAGDYYYFTKAFYYTSAWYGGFSYVDLMVPGVTEKFLEVTMKNGYEKYVKEEFGKSVKGIFSDEPNIEVWDTISVRWTPLLFPAFKEKWKYNLEEHLPSLFEETGDWKKVRHDYFSVLLQLFIEHWSKPMNKYTEQNGLEWTGHYWEHEWPSALHVPDNMAMYAWHQRPGIDMLFNQFDEVSNTAQFGNIRALRELASVANQLGKKRTLSETYGGGGWELTFKDMKRLGDWEFVTGVNTLNQHLAYMTMQGARKYDYPQSFSYHNPWWPYYKGLNQHFARLSLSLSSGKQKNDILIIEPTTSAWMYYSYTHSAKRFYEIGQNFQSFVTRLEKAQVEYDLGSEDIIRDHGKVADNKFIVGEASYKTIVLPPGTESIDNAVFILLKKFADAGGKIILFDNLQFIDGKENKNLQEFISHCSRFDGLSSLNNDVVNKYFSNEAISFPGLDTASAKLYHQRRELADGQLLFLVNSSMEKTAIGNFMIKGRDAVLLNTQTGEINDYPEIQAGNELKITYDIPEAGSLLLFIANKALNLKRKSNTESREGQLVPASTMTIKRMRPNVLTIDFCDLVLKDTALKQQYFYEATDLLFKRNGFNDGNPWNTSVQFKDQTIRRDTFSRSSGFKVSYHFIVDGANTDAFKLKAVVEKSYLWDVYINDVKINPNQKEWWLDKNFSVFMLDKHIVKGQNTITLLAPKMSVFAEIEPVYIIGDFGLSPDTAAWKIIPASAIKIGSWKEQGLPLYGHEVVYSKTFKVPERKKKYQVELGKWKGTVALLKVNDRQVTVLTGNEHSYDISGYIHPGSNKVELIVTGSLKNTVGPHYYKPAPGMVSPWHWRYIYKQIPGKEYDLYGYGLLEEFQVMRY